MTDHYFELPLVGADAVQTLDLIAQLPVSGVIPGSIYFVLEDGNIYTFTGSAWVKGAGGGGGSGTVTSVATGTGLTGGPITTTGTVSLANTAVVAGVYGSSTQVPVVTVDAQGRLTSATTAAISSGTVTSVASGTGLTGGPVTSTGTLSLANTAVTPGTFGSASQVGTFTVDQQGRLTSASNTAIAIAGSVVTGAGNITSPTTGVTVTNGTGATLGPSTTIAVQTASGAQPGLLSAADWTTFNGKGSGTVTAVSVASANGLAGSSSGGSTPALTLSTSVTGVLKGNGTAISAATAGTDYALGTSALATGILKSTTSTGAHTIAVAADFPTLNQNTTGTAANVTGTVAVANGGTGATTYTTGSLPYYNGTILAQDNANLFYDSATPRLSIGASSATTVRVGIGTSSPATALEISGFSTSNSSFKTGSLELQPFSLNNAWIAENAYYDGTNWKYRSTGGAGLFYFYGTEGQFRFFASGTGGTSIPSPNTATLKTSQDGSFAVGKIASTPGTLTGAKFVVTAAGKVGIGPTVPVAVLDVTGDAAISTSVSTIKVISTGTSPSIAGGGTIGTGGTVAFVGTAHDESGQFTITAGTGATAAVVTVTFGAAAYAAAPNVVFAPANLNAAGIVTTTYVSSQSTTAFSIACGALTNASAYTFTYIVKQ